MISPEELAQLRNEVAKASVISSLIGNDEVQAVLNGLLHGAQNDWIAATDRETRELLWLRARGLTDFTEALRTIIETGRMAAMQLEQYKRDGQDHE